MFVHLASVVQVNLSQFDHKRCINQIGVVIGPKIFFFEKTASNNNNDDYDDYEEEDNHCYWPVPVCLASLTFPLIVTG